MVDLTKKEENNNMKNENTRIEKVKAIYQCDDIKANFIINLDYNFLKYINNELCSRCLNKSKNNNIMEIFESCFRIELLKKLYVYVSNNNPEHILIPFSEDIGLNIKIDYANRIIFLEPNSFNLKLSYNTLTKIEETFKLKNTTLNDWFNTNFFESSTSDYNINTNIENIIDKLSFLIKLKPKEYQYAVSYIQGNYYDDLENFLKFFTYSEEEYTFYRLRLICRSYTRFDDDYIKQHNTNHHFPSARNELISIIIFQIFKLNIYYDEYINAVFNLESFSMEEKINLFLRKMGLYHVNMNFQINSFETININTLFYEFSTIEGYYAYVNDYFINPIEGDHTLRNSDFVTYIQKNIDDFDLENEIKIEILNAFNDFQNYLIYRNEKQLMYNSYEIPIKITYDKLLKQPIVDLNTNWFKYTLYYSNNFENRERAMYKCYDYFTFIRTLDPIKYVKHDDGNMEMYSEQKSIYLNKKNYIDLPSNVSSKFKIYLNNNNIYKVSKDDYNFLSKLNTLNDILIHNELFHIIYNNNNNNYKLCTFFSDKLFVYTNYNIPLKPENINQLSQNQKEEIYLFCKKIVNATTDYTKLKNNIKIINNINNFNPIELLKKCNFEDNDYLIYSFKIEFELKTKHKEKKSPIKLLLNKYIDWYIKILKKF